MINFKFVFQVVQSTPMLYYCNMFPSHNINAALGQVKNVKKKPAGGNNSTRAVLLISPGANLYIYIKRGFLAFRCRLNDHTWRCRVSTWVAKRAANEDAIEISVFLLQPCVGVESSLLQIKSSSEKQKTILNYDMQGRICDSL